MVQTRTRYYGPPMPPETLAQRRARWSTLLRTHQYHTLIREVLSRELRKYNNSTIFRPSSLSSIMRECVLILASAPLMFLAAVDGELATRFSTDIQLQTEYGEIRARAHRQPSIYIHLLANEAGTAPSINQYMAIRSLILQYIGTSETDADLAWKIDNVSPPRVARSDTSQAFRKYLWTKCRSLHRLATLEKFCAGVLTRYNTTPRSERNVALVYPPVECGYALNSHLRLEQHRKHLSSNYVMNLVEDICAYLHASGAFEQRFLMHPYIIYLIFRPCQVEVAEMFVSGLLQVWVDEGGGFNAHPAGLSCASKRRVSRGQWKEFERWVREKSCLRDRLKRQREMLELGMLRLGTEEEEIWRKALDSDDEDEDDALDLDFMLEVGDRGDAIDDGYEVL